MTAASVRQWRVDLDARDEAAYGALSSDHLWNGYSIADLEPPFRAYARFAVAGVGDGAPSAACLFLRHPSFSSIIPHGDPAGLAAILEKADLPPESFLLARPEHLAVVGRHYTPRGELQTMLRLAVDRVAFNTAFHATALPAMKQGALHVERLSPDDLPLLLDLYAGYEASVFDRDQLQSGPFYGVRRGGALLAAGGIHAVSARHGIAAAGNFYTRPEERGRGYASAIAAAVVAELLAGRCEDVILNVAAANTVAQRVYHRLGFRTHCGYLEGRVARR